MLYEEWLKNKWNVYHFKEDPNEEEINAFDFLRNKLIFEIRDAFKDLSPKYVVYVSKDTFMDLPRNEKDNWPDLASIQRWVKENSSNLVYEYDSTTYIFADETDATAFLLKWG